VTKLLHSGGHPALDAMRKEIPAGALELLAVPGLRPEKALKLHRDLGISSLAELETAARADRLRHVKGLGAALQKKILQGLEIRREAEGAGKACQSPAIAVGIGDVKRPLEDVKRL